MHNAENIVAVRHGVNNYPDREHVKNLVDILVSHKGLAVNAVDALDPAADVDVLNRVLCAVENLGFYVLDKPLALAFLEHNRLLNFLVADGIEVLQRTVLELLLDGFDTETVSDRRENLHIFD